MSNIHLTDELLMAFADGELDDAVADAVAQAVARDPSAGQKIAKYVRSRQVVRSALSSPEHLKVSAELLSAVTKRIEAVKASDSPLHRAPHTTNRIEARTNPSRHRVMSWLPLAASFTAVAIGLGGFIAGRYSESAFERSSSILSHLDSPEIERLLGSVPSGKEEAVSFGQLRIAATYRTETGNLCREFSAQHAPDKVNAIACRSGAEWNVVVAVNEPDGASYSPAGNDEDLIGSYLRKVGAGEPLAPVTEQTLLGK